MFGVLGPLQAPEPLRLGGAAERRESRILGALLLSANEPVAMSSLVDLLWRDRPPSTARQQVQNCVSAIDRQFRQAGLPSVRRVPRGYSIDVDRRDLDALRFLADVDHGRQRTRVRDHEGASVAFARALATWRGEVLAGVQLGPFEPIALHLSDLRLSTQEAFYDCELQARRYSEVVPALQMLVHRHPVRERLVGQLMRALAAVGRTNEALDQFHRTRTLLAEDYGVAVGPDLDAVFRGILRQEPCLPEHLDGAAAAGELRRALDHLRQAMDHLERALRRTRQPPGTRASGAVRSSRDGPP